MTTTSESARPTATGRLPRTLPSRAALARIGIVVLLVLLWDTASRLGWVDPLFVSTPTAVAGAAVDLAGESVVWAALRETGLAILIAFVAGTAGGVLAGLAIGLSALIREAYFGAVLFVLSTPKSIFVPIFLLMFGIGPNAAAAFGAFEAFFYVTVSVVGGVGLVEDRHLRIARAFRASTWHRFIDVVLPAAAPGIFTGLWFGIKHAFLGVTIVELYVSAGGLGRLIHQYTTDLATDKVFALIGTVVVAAVVAGALWTRLERRLGRWRRDPAAASVGV